MKRRIFCIIFFLTFYFYSYARSDATSTNDIEYEGIQIITGRYYEIFREKCPGVISGKCTQPLYVFTHRIINIKDMKKDKFHMNKDELYILDMGLPAYGDLFYPDFYNSIIGKQIFDSIYSAKKQTNNPYFSTEDHLL